MKTNQKLAVAALAGVSIGITGAMAIQIQQVKTPPGHVIAEVETTEPAYAAIRPIWQSAARSRIFIVEGVVPY